jgi:GNAT superfamily N-acetyltransferase
MTTEHKTTYTLEMRHPDDLRPKLVEMPGLRIERMAVPCPEFNKFLHTVIGQPFRWGGRTNWDKETWYAYANRDNLETWVAYLEGTPVGYCEMEKGDEGDVHIWNFGLLCQFIGQGLGGHLLTRALERAWAWGATRVWLRTCSHDHPHALKNYLARGFRIRKTDQGPANPPLKSFWELITGAK